MTAIRLATTGDAAAIRRLLADNRLPVDDLDSAAIAFLVASEDERLVGVVGIEPFGGAGLLRSLAVTPTARRNGLGQALVATAEAYAREDAGLSELVLLTTTAAPFFARRGYVDIPRAATPLDVQASAEFKSICPASATCMRKFLGGAP